MARTPTEKVSNTPGWGGQSLPVGMLTPERGGSRRGNPALRTATEERNGAEGAPARPAHGPHAAGRSRDPPAHVLHAPAMGLHS